MNLTKGICTGLAVVAIGAATAPDATAQSNSPPPRAATAPRRGGRFMLRAPDLTSRGRIAISHVFNGMGCTGQNISPTLEWSHAPAGTKSFAVTAYDPDAPTGSGWWHWVMYNIPATTTSLAAGAGNGRNAPRGSTQGTTDFGTRGYGGPCPPPGDSPHHYKFTVFALKVDKLDLPGNATAAYVGFNLNANKLATASVTALYGR
ncbi:MAG TPA: YbhB/YbcL family Raf kinase inhibitor-like protein [Gemmatimonadaceae bacterium]|jgi:Raf kinase inhibitor-like YbhB/YbcL family protein|nr:YbhB/YbcL family Raf kinase inhibitor-like protein [Gemmatimonadaceae bacterium]